jgi:putative nucleotidyltransferase with HDIG domain
MKFPSNEECLAWYEELGTPENIIDHVKAVNRIANLIAQELKKKGIRIDLDIVDRASLLHDLDKWNCINDRTLNHGFVTEQMLTRKGFPQLGFYARQHRADLILEKLDSWEEKVISYADKRCNGDKVVSIKERYDYVNEKYPAKDMKKRNEEIRLFFELEKELFSIMGMKPEDIR